MNPIVRTQPGEVRGVVVEGVNAFKGVPYAAPPFGANRLLPPRPVEPWTGVRDATALGFEPPQVHAPPDIAALYPDPCVVGEDCLNLNIWTPDLGPARLPVMVWIPGGQFEVGSNGPYDGSRFARDGVVCVAIHYRVGAEGFLDVGERGNANRGLLDQVAALEWVRDNIAAFGGDPANVTIFGESAGAISVATLLSMPAAKGLFRRAIAQSGAGHHGTPAADARRIAAYLAERLEVAPTREGFASVPFDRLLEAQAALSAEVNARPDPARFGRQVSLSFLPWQPVVDGEVLPARPIDGIAAGAGAEIDLIVGTNADEHRLFFALGGLLDSTTDEMLAASAAGYGVPLEAAQATYRAANPRARPGDVFAALMTDWYWRIPAIRLADAHARKAASGTYMYEFAWPSPEYGGQIGACHALEVPFVFDTLAPRFQPMMGAALGSNPPQQLADAMHGAWVAFARTGDPGWPRYDLSRRATLRFDATSRVVDDPRSAERALWEGRR